MSTDFNDATTTELLALPVCKEIVATFAGMADLSSFENNPDKLANLVDVMDSATEVPASLSEYTIDQVRHAAEMVRWCVLKDQGAYDDSLLEELLGFDDDEDDEPTNPGFRFSSIGSHDDGAAFFLSDDYDGATGD